MNAADYNKKFKEKNLPYLAKDGKRAVKFFKIYAYYGMKGATGGYQVSGKQAKEALNK